jgi:hypothetical protein
VTSTGAIIGQKEQTRQSPQLLHLQLNHYITFSFAFCHPFRRLFHSIRYYIGFERFRARPVIFLSIALEFAADPREVISPRVIRDEK